jgi:hypothetical protein
MKTTEMKTLRKMVGKTKAGLIITQDTSIKRQCDVQGIGEWTTRRGGENVSRTATEESVRSVKDNSLTDRRGPGRPDKIQNDIPEATG